MELCQLQTLYVEGAELFLVSEYHMLDSDQSEAVSADVSEQSRSKTRSIK